MTDSKPSTIRVMTWNVQHANAMRARRQVSWLTRVAADVVVLTEVSAGATGDLTAQWLQEAGYSVRLPDPGIDRYRVLMAARGVIDPVDAGIQVMANRFVAARIKQPTGYEFTVAGLYVPSRGPIEKRNVAKREFQDAVTAALPGLTEQVPSFPCVITGDLNVVEPGHVPHYRVFGAWEYDFYRSFAAHGFADAFRLRYPSAVEHSWFGRQTQDGNRNGYRFDHTFISAEHRNMVHDCTYQHSPRLEALSDHSAMTLTLHM